MHWTAWITSSPARVCATPNSIVFVMNCSASFRHRRYLGQNPATAQRRSRADKAPWPGARRRTAAGARSGRRRPRRTELSPWTASAAEAAVNSNNLRVDNLFDKIQDIRRKNFTSALFQPIPGLYATIPGRICRYICPTPRTAFATWSRNWWDDPQNRADVSRATLEALLILLLLSILSWRGIRRLRRWQDDGEPPYWRRASAAAGVILLRALPVVAPVVFLYAMIASSQNLPERLDWLFYLTAQSIVIVFIVGALVTDGVCAARTAMAAHRRIGCARRPHLRPRPLARFCLQPDEPALWRHPACSGALRADHRGRPAVELAVVGNRGRAAAHDTGRRCGRRTVRAPFPDDPHDRLDHRRRYRRVCAHRLPAVGPVFGTAIDRHGFDPRARLSVVALGRRLCALARRR